jgi:hypothetical protein
VSDKSASGMNYDFFTPCPGCGEIRFSVQAWVEGVQMMQCADDECRVHEYEPRYDDTETDRPASERSRNGDN